MNALNQGRESFRRQTWGDAYSLLSAADRQASLEPDDLECLAVAAYLTGRDGECSEFLVRAHHHFLRLGDTSGAARCGFWLAFSLLNRGEMAQASGWLSRAQRLLDDGQIDCVERGYLLLPVALQSLDQGDSKTAYSKFSEISEVAERFQDSDLMTLGRLGRGQSMVRLGETAKGVALLDEVMVTVTSGEVSPIIAGIVYCAVIEACQETFDLRRAQEWTTALTRWCESQPDLVPYRGQCLVHRAEIMQLHGAWPDAVDEARRACEQLSGKPAVGAAFYQRAELHRLHGEFTKAEEAYRQASRWGRQPEPGLALLRLAQGQVNAAEAAIRRVLDETKDRLLRYRLLAGYVEIMVAAGDLQAARAGANELSDIAAATNTPFLQALSAHALGAVLLAEGDARAALTALRRAWITWQELNVPYEAARARVLIGLACRGIGDEGGAELELDAARWSFQQLGAVPDMASVDFLSHKPDPTTTGGLTAREVEVLKLVAAGKTNRAIATELFLSEKTVARHISNIFTKLNISTRAAATAYAYEQGLV